MTVLQTLRGHTNQVLAISFDTARILSAGRDSELRYWIWGEKREGAQDKYHTFNKGETLTHIAENYDISLDTIMKWNGIRELKEVYVGMRLLVRKADPTVFTKAEMKQFAQEKRMAEGQKYARDKMLKHSLDLGGFKEKSRVYKLATDIDKHTLGNRLFGAEKQLSDLLPENPDNHRNWHSLGTRIRENTGQTRPFHGMPPRYFPNKANIDEWGEVSDAVVLTMLDIFVEFQAYEVVIEAKKQVRNKESIIGRTLMPMDEKIKRDVMSRGGKKCKKQMRIEEAQKIAAANEEKRQQEQAAAESGTGEGQSKTIVEQDKDGDVAGSGQSHVQAKKGKGAAVTFDKLVDAAQTERNASKDKDNIAKDKKREKDKKDRGDKDTDKKKREKDKEDRDIKKEKVKKDKKVKDTEDKVDKKDKEKDAGLDVEQQPPMEKAMSHVAGSLAHNSEYDYHSSDDNEDYGSDSSEEENVQEGGGQIVQPPPVSMEEEEDDESANLLADILGGGDGDY